MITQRYLDHLLAELDAMPTVEKDHLILGLVEQLYPNGDPDHPLDGATFLAEAIRLLTPFHPSQLRPATTPEEPRDDLAVAEF